MNEKKKIIYGQFFTKGSVWLREHIKNFILESKTDLAYDPFAGAGDLLNVAKELGYTKTEGLDVDTNLNWKFNDSLEMIPHLENAIIITNPPYISNYSAARKKVGENLKIFL